MSGLRTSHPVWLLRRAAVLGGLTPQSAEPPAPGRAAVFHRLAKASAALEGRAPFTLTPDERAVLATEAHALAERVAAELGRRDGRDLRRSEEWLHTARVLREVLEAAGADRHDE